MLSHKSQYLKLVVVAKEVRYIIFCEKKQPEKYFLLCFVTVCC